MSRNNGFVVLNGIGGLLAALLASGSMAAEGPRYTYGQLSYIDVEFNDLDSVDADGDGFNVGGSFAVADMVHIFAGYTDGEIDVDDFGFGDISADYSQLSAGLGVNYGVSDTVDLVGRLAYINVEIEVSGFSQDEDGYGLSGGVRAMIMPQLELNGGVVYSDLGGGFDSDTALELGAVYNFTDMFAAVAGVSFSDDVTEYGIGARLYFGSR